MNKFEYNYTIVGSSALKSHKNELIIEFPVQDDAEALQSSDSDNLFHRIQGRIQGSKLVQDLSDSSFQGKSFNRAKPWQAVLASTGFFAFAVVCIFIGR